MATNGVRIKLATSEHRDGILSIAENVFIKTEPVRVATGVQWREAKLGWEKLVGECLKHPHSHVAVNDKNEVVGFRLSRIMESVNFDPEESINDFILPGHVRTIEDRLTKDWAKIFVNERGQICKKLLQFQALAVHPDYAGRGLALKLCQENLALGKELGCEWCSVVASNWMSQRVFEKLGFETKASISFEDFKDETGHRPFEVRDSKQKGSKWQVKRL